jgi:hypothetical protein
MPVYRLSSLIFPRLDLPPASFLQWNTLRQKSPLAHNHSCCPICNSISLVTLFYHHTSITMARGLNWTSSEVSAAAKAYVSATNNPLKGADQKLNDFVADILKKLEQLAPYGLKTSDGTFHNRGFSAWAHLRDSVFRDVQKFNEALRIVYLSVPSGVTEEQKINMAVAIHMNKTKHMNYDYKDYDSKKWRNYFAWLNLKDLPKFMYSETPVIVNVEASASVVAEHDVQHDTSRGESGSRKAKAAQSRDSAQKRRDEQRAAQNKEVCKGMASMVKLGQDRLLVDERRQRSAHCMYGAKIPFLGYERDLLEYI